MLLVWASTPCADGLEPNVDVKVSAPLAVLVGFLPADSDPFWRDAGASEHAFHLATALTSAAACLESKGVTFRTVHADRLDLNLAGVSTIVDLQAAGRVGVVLAREGAAPKIVSCSAGSSPLQVVVPVVAARYFEHPECIPEEWSDIFVSEQC